MIIYNKSGTSDDNVREFGVKVLEEVPVNSFLCEITGQLVLGGREGYSCLCGMLSYGCGDSTLLFLL